MNQPTTPPFRESVRCAEQNLYTRAKSLVGDRDPREHKFSVQLRAFDAAKTGSALGVAALLALCAALLDKSLKAGMVVVGGLNLGGGSPSTNRHVTGLRANTWSEVEALVLGGQQEYLKSEGSM